MKKKKIICLVIVVIILFILSIIYYEKHKFVPIINLNENLNIEFASKASVKQIISDSNVSIVDEDINTLCVGKQELNIKYLDNRNREKVHKVNIDIVDHESPIILGGGKTAYVGDKIDLLKGVICADNADSNLKCTVEGEYDFDTAGKYNLKYVATDSSGNTTSKGFVLNVIEHVEQPAPSKPKESIEVKPDYILFSDILKKYKNDKTSIGIDVSRWQGDVIDFNAVKNAGAEFVFIRIGLQDGFNGDYEYDKNYIQNISNATSAGLKVGLYFYSYANSSEEAIKQANWVIDNIGDYKIELPIAFDWENWSDFNDLNLNLFQFNDIAYSFMNEIRKRGHNSILYGSKNYLQYMWKPKNYDVWLAQYNDDVTYEGKYNLWQLTDKGKIDGIDKNTDVDILYLN